jgi:hypothetical protein
MSDKLTWAEFADKYKPKDGDKFLDDRGQEWSFKTNYFFTKCGAIVSLEFGSSGYKMTCPLIPPQQKLKLWPAIYNYHNAFGKKALTVVLYETEGDARNDLRDIFVSWPAVPNADGSYEVPE